MCGSLTTVDVINTVKILFDGHPDLLVGFNQFLPPGHKLETDQASADSNPTEVSGTTVQQPQAVGEPSEAAAAPKSQAAVDFSDARDFVKRVKTKFAETPTIYKQFLELLHQYHKKDLTIDQVYASIHVLFTGHEDLQNDFKKFLPAGAQAPQESKQ